MFEEVLWPDFTSEATYSCPILFIEAVMGQCRLRGRLQTIVDWKNPSACLFVKKKKMLIYVFIWLYFSKLSKLLDGWIQFNSNFPQMYLWLFPVTQISLRLLYFSVIVHHHFNFPLLPVSQLQWTYYTEHIRWMFHQANGDCALSVILVVKWDIDYGSQTVEVMMSH